MTTAVAEPVAPASVDLLAKYKGAEKFLRDNAIERDEESELLMLCSIAGVDPLFIGVPGVAKTYQIKMLVNHVIQGASLFTALLHKNLTPKHVLGPESMEGIRTDEVKLLTKGFLPSANYAYLDEFFKAGAFLLNPLLDILADRVLRFGDQEQDCSQLIAVFMSSNELPTSTELTALRDRIGLTKKVEPVRTPEGRKAVMRLQANQRAKGLDTSKLDPLTLPNIGAIREQVRLIPLNEAIVDALNTAQEGWISAGHEPSQRRVGQMLNMVKACAWAGGRTEIALEDLVVTQHMAYNHLTDAETARDVIVEIASEFLRVVKRLQTNVKAEMDEVDKVKQLIESMPEGDARDTKAREEGSSHLTKLAGFEKEILKTSAQAAKNGRRVDDLESLRNAVVKQKNWLSMEIYGVTA